MIPRCPWCGKKAPKATETIWRPPVSELPSDAPWAYHGDLQVVRSVKWRGYLHRVIVWDGMTFRHRYHPFCTLDHAQQFAHAAYRAGYRIKAG